MSEIDLWTQATYRPNDIRLVRVSTVRYQDTVADALQTALIANSYRENLLIRH